MADYPAAEQKTGRKKSTDNDAICKEAVKRYQKWTERERDNTNAAYDDLKFRAGEQWDVKAKEARVDRPCLIINRIPQFIRQVTGDMRQMKPGIKTVPVDSRGDKDTAETLAGMIRYIENRSDASAIYMGGAESQVTAGIGHWSVTKEYADGTTFNQELRIIGIDDQVAVACDPDAKMPMREDAKWWIIPVDMSRETFEENYPDALVEDFDDADMAAADGWFDQDFVRVAAYWVKKPIKRVLALLPDGSISDLTDKDEAEREEIGKTAKKVETRDSYKVCRYLITACHVLEETDWPGMNIPIIPCFGEEIKIGKRTVRHGLTRFARDPQRMYNYYSSAETEVVALQPKSPFMATDKNVEQNRNMWATANTEPYSVLIYTPDSKNGGIAPQRVQPPVSSQGIAEGLLRSAEDMKAVIGIYDPGLGQKSNETSGKAIIARQREGDTGTYIYIENWTRSIRRTGSILIDLIPHVYDTERMIRVMGEDGKVDLKWINKPTGIQEIDDTTGLPGAAKIENDVTVGAYDIVLESGPSYTTKREEARDSMREFIQAAPEAAPVIMDLIAKSQDWPLADEIGKRFEAMAPPPIQQLLAKQKQESGEEEQPDPMKMQAMAQQQQMQQMQMAAAQLDLENKQLANDKLRAEIGDILNGDSKNPPVDPAETMRAQLELRKLELEVQATASQQQRVGEEQQVQRANADFDFQHKTRMAELEHKKAQGEVARQMQEADMAESDVTNATEKGVVPSERRHQESMQGMMMLAEALQKGLEANGEGLKALAQAISAPKRVVRDQRNQVVGVEPAHSIQ